MNYMYSVLLKTRSHKSKGSIKYTIELILNDYRVSTFLKTKKIYYNIGAYRSSVLRGKEIRKKNNLKPSQYLNLKIE